MVDVESFSWHCQWPDGFGKYNAISDDMGRVAWPSGSHLDMHGTAIAKTSIKKLHKYIAKNKTTYLFES